MPLSLEKNDTVPLDKGAGEPELKVVTLGLGWDPVQGAPAVDLDASALLYSGGQVVDTVSFKQLNARNGFVAHTGDNLTGDGEGDDEQIEVDLPGLAGTEIDKVVLVVTSYSGQQFTGIDNAFVRLVDTDNGGEELLRYTLSGKQPNTAVVMAKLVKDGGIWKMTAVGEFTEGREAKDVAQVAAAA